MEKRFNKEETVKIRRDLHHLAEPSLKEVATRNYILDYLSSMDLNAKEVLETGIVSFIDFGKEETIAFRAEMDALEMQEETCLSFAANGAFTHACGHDAHMAMLLSFAKAVSTMKDAPYNVLLIFQPAEEGPGRGKEMSRFLSSTAEYKKIVAIFAFHLMPTVPQGKIALKNGAVFAGSTELYFDVCGKSAHVAQSELGVDAVRISAEFIDAFYRLSESIKKEMPHAMAIGKINGGTRMNVIAEIVHLEGTARYYNEKTKRAIFGGVDQIIKNLEAKYACKIIQNHIPFYEPVINDSMLFYKLSKIIANKTEINPLFTADDFCYYSSVAPSFYMLLGCKNEEKGYIYPLHSPHFDFDEDILETGVKTYLKILLGYTKM